METSYGHPSITPNFKYLWHDKTLRDNTKAKMAADGKYIANEFHLYDNPRLRTILSMCEVYKIKDGSQEKMRYRYKTYDFI